MSSTDTRTGVSASCAICRDNFDEVSETSATRCGHCFHTRCLMEWLKQSKTCPQCRRQVGNPSEVLRVFLSFGSPGEDMTSGDEPSGLAELRQRLTAMTEEASVTKKKLKRIERLDAQRRRDLSQRQQQINAFAEQLETCQESIEQQVAENSQLMQLLAQESATQEAQVQDARRQLQEAEARGRESEESARRLLAENIQLCQGLATVQQEVAHLEDCLQQERAANVKLTDQLLAAEAESFALSKRLAVGHAGDSKLANRLQKSELTVQNLTERLLCLETRAAASTASQEEIPLANFGSRFSSLPPFLTSRPVSNTVKAPSLSAEI